MNVSLNGWTAEGGKVFEVFENVVVPLITRFFRYLWIPLLQINFAKGCSENVKILSTDYMRFWSCFYLYCPKEYACEY